MTDHCSIGKTMQQHYEAVWQSGDAWHFETSAYEQSRFAHLLAVLGDRSYGQSLEIGCGSGCFTRLLAGIANRVVALDIASAAIARARVQTAEAGPGVVDLRTVNIMEYDPRLEAPWDLIVLSETIYCLAWLYPFFDVAWLAARLFEATRPGGRLLLTNTYGQQYKDWLLRPWLIHTYRDLFRNVGYVIEAEEVFRGTKQTIDTEVLTTLFLRTAAREGRDSL